MLTGKERMLRAYRGEAQDRAPVAPEFWNYIGAKTLGVSMETFEREGLLNTGLCAAFQKYETEGWSIAFPAPIWGDRKIRQTDTRQPDGKLLVKTETLWRGQSFTEASMFDKAEPNWLVSHLAESADDIPLVAEMMLSNDVRYDTAAMKKVWQEAGETCLCEVYTGGPFFDFIESLAGFEEAAAWFAEEDEEVIADLQNRYTAHQLAMMDQILEETQFESFFIGCSSSCNSLIGPRMWRKWDKPYIQAVCDHLHSRGKLLHIHFHGRSIETVEYFAELGLDCVCPFERGPGGDVNTLEDLLHVRRALAEKTTFNGNIHTVETLLRGTPEDVRREVRQVKEAFQGSSRLIIGSGDQVAGDTPEENIWAMVEEAKR